VSQALFIGNRVIRLKEVDSTNNYLKSIVSEQGKVNEGLVVVADFQSRGRGQLGTTWLSEPDKNLCFSIYLEPKVAIQDQFLISQLASLALVDVLKSLGMNGVQVKWPNDIYVGELKIAGTLIENSIKGNLVASSIIGIGLNVNQLKFDSSIKDATSVSLELNCVQLNLNDLLEQYFSFLQQRYIAFRVNHSYNEIRNEYTQLLYQKGQCAKYKIEEEQVEGEIKGVNREGRLLVEIGGEVRSFNLKEIQFIK